MDFNQTLLNCALLADVIYNDNPKVALESTGIKHDVQKMVCEGVEFWFTNNTIFLEHVCDRTLGRIKYELIEAKGLSKSDFSFPSEGCPLPYELRVLQY